VPLAAEHTVGIAIFSYNGTMVLGLSADRDSTSDLQVLADGIEDGFAELLEALPAAPEASLQEQRSVPGSHRAALRSVSPTAGTSARARARSAVRRPSAPRFAARARWSAPELELNPPHPPGRTGTRSP